MAKLTPAGERMLRKYLELEAAGLPVVADNRHQTSISAQLLRHGNGSDKKTAEKLAADGFIHLNWNFNGLYTVRHLIITDEGRKIINEIK